MSQALSPDRVQHVTIRGLEIAYRRTGEGPPIVLLHGGPTNSREFRRQLQDLSNEFTLIAWDMPGCGQSADPSENFGIADYVGLLADFIAALGLAQPHVLGLSFGTGLALEPYRAYPDLPRSLILVSAYAGWAGSLPPDVAEQRRQRMMHMIELPPDAWAREWMPTLVTDQAPGEVVAELESILFEFHPTGQRRLLHSGFAEHDLRRLLHSGFAEHDLRDLLPRISVPTLLVYGEKDMRSPLSVAEAMHASIPGSQLVVIPGAGHMVDMQAADRLNSEVRQFLHSVHT